jgi:mannonate dehydratase
MKLSFRWYGDNDPVPLAYIRQIPGVHTIVSAVYDVKPGQVWPESSLEHLRAQCRAQGLRFEVVESIPVSEAIKLGTADREAHLAAYCENIRRCARCGVKCITYNFMPVFDWTRTQLDRPAADGSTSLVLDQAQLAGLDPLRDDMDLPGWDASYDQAEIRDLLRAYGQLGAEGLWENLAVFLRTVIPVAADCGVTMALHPDDPPYPIFGLPRIITDQAALDQVLDLVDDPANSLCLCSGSLGCVDSNDVAALVARYAARGRVAFLHLRNVRRYPDGSFAETAHPSACGSLDLYAIVRAAVDAGFDGYVRPDHGRMIWGEQGRPGYGLYDRALGAAYLNGLFEACEQAERKRA